MFTFDQFTLEVTHHLHSYSMATFCRADKHRGKAAGGNDLVVDQEGKEAGLSVPRIVFPFQVD